MAGKELPWFIHFTAFFTGGFKGYSDKHRQQASDILTKVAQLQQMEGLTEDGVSHMRQAYMDAQFTKFANGLLRSVDRCKHLAKVIDQGHRGSALTRANSDLDSLM